MQQRDIAPAFPQAIFFEDVDAETIAAEDSNVRTPGSWIAYMRKMLPPVASHVQHANRLRLVSAGAF